MRRPKKIFFGWYVQGRFEIVSGQRRIGYYDILEEIQKAGRIPMQFLCLLQVQQRLQSPAFLVGQIFVRQNATTCLSLRQEHSSADGVSMWQPQPSGTRFHHSAAHHPLVVDSLELGWKPISKLSYAHLWELSLKSVIFYITFTVKCNVN